MARTIPVAKEVPEMKEVRVDDLAPDPLVIRTMPVRFKVEKEPPHQDPNHPPGGVGGGAPASSIIIDDLNEIDKILEEANTKYVTESDFNKLTDKIKTLEFRLKHLEKKNGLVWVEDAPNLEKEEKAHL